MPYYRACGSNPQIKRTHPAHLPQSRGVTMIRHARLSALAIWLAASLIIVPWPAHGLDHAQAMQPELDPDVYEPDDTVEQAHPLLPVGIPQARTFHTPEDVDWAYIDLDAGDRIGISTTGPCDTFLT